MSNLDTSALEASLATLNFWLDVSIATVVIGLILEYAPRSFSRFVCKIRHETVDKIGEVLVILGVAGELALHILSGQVEEKIKSAQKVELARLNDSAASALQKAADANERAEILQRENLVMAETISPRAVASERAIDALSKYAGTKYFVVSAPDLEPRSTAAQIRFVLRNAGWQKLENLPPTLKAPPKAWIWSVALEYDVSARDKSTRTWEAIGALSGQLSSSGISNKPTHSDIPEGWPSDAVRIVVGLKPTDLSNKPGIWGETAPVDWEEK